MNQGQIAQWVDLLGLKHPAAQSRGGWFVCECPLGPWRHEGGKSNPTAFGIKIEPGDSFCNCFSCAWHGTQSTAMVELQKFNKQSFHRKYPFAEAMQLIAQAEDGVELEGLNAPGIEEMLFGKRGETMHAFPEWWLGSFPDATDVPFAVEYMQKRGIPKIIAQTLDLKADTDQKRLCFPVRDFQGVLRGLHGRAVEDDVDPRYRMYTQAKKNNPIVWLGEAWVDLTKPIVVVEGPVDLTSIFRVYRNVVSPLFVNPSFAKINRMADALEWITFYDRGKGGDIGRARVDQALPNHVVTHLKPPDGRKDPGEMSVDEVGTTLKPLVNLDPPLID